MVNLDEIFFSTNVSINESKKSNICEFDNVCTTFADIRDVIQEATKDIFNITPIQECVTGYITFKNNDFLISPNELGSENSVPLKTAKANIWKLPKQQHPYMEKTLKDIYNTISTIDGNFFENGKNYLKCIMTSPLKDHEKEYDNKFLVVFPEVAQFDAGMNKIDGTPEHASEILNTAKTCPCLACMQDEQIAALKRVEKCKAQLEVLKNQLEKMTDGLGWRCSFDQYIEDKYSRYIVNAAMKHGIDVSHNSQFVKTLVKRLAEIAARGKPTKSDLATYAKSDKVDFKSEACRNFLTDIEQNANQTNIEILEPVYKFTKILSQIVCNIIKAISLFDASNDVKIINKCKALRENDTVLDRKDMSTILKYCDHGPKTKIVGCNGKLYSMTTDFSSIMAISKLFDIV